MLAKDLSFLENKGHKLTQKQQNQDLKLEFYIKIKISQSKKKTFKIMRNFKFLNQKLNIFLFLMRKNRLKFKKNN